MRKKIPTKIRFDKKMEINDSEGFLLTTKFYNSSNAVSILVPQKWNPGEKSSIESEYAEAKNQQKTATKQLAMQNIHANKLHNKLGHPG